MSAPLPNSDDELVVTYVIQTRSAIRAGRLVRAGRRVAYLAAGAVLVPSPLYGESAGILTTVARTVTSLGGW